MSILHLTLKREWFDLIASGKKKVEYREIKPYWETRFLEGGKFFAINYKTIPKKFKYIIFKNGYSKRSPRMKVECKRLRLMEYEGRLHFAWILGRVLWVKNR